MLAKGATKVVTIQADSTPYLPSRQSPQGPPQKAPIQNASQAAEVAGRERLQRRSIAVAVEDGMDGHEGKFLEAAAPGNHDTHVDRTRPDFRLARPPGKGREGEKKISAEEGGSRPKSRNTTTPETERQNSKKRPGPATQRPKGSTKRPKETEKEKKRPAPPLPRIPKKTTKGQI